MVSKQTSIINATGLHARPASVFVTEAKKYQSNVTIKNVDKDSAPVNAKSIMMILAAGLGTGTKVEVACDGADEQEALDALEADHDFLLEGDVFTEDLISTWIEYKRENELKPLTQVPHPLEFQMYYGV